jgi:hypothetical protein
MGMPITDRHAWGHAYEHNKMFYKYKFGDKQKNRFS